MTGAARATGIVAGFALDAVLADPRRWHPVAGFGQAAAALERRIYADNRRWGVGYVGVAVGVPVVLGALAERAVRGRPLLQAGVTAMTTWVVLGGTSLGREGALMATFLEAGDVERGRGRLGHLCARDPSGMDAAGLARATVESLAENTSDAVVAPLLWGAVAGVPGLVGYRAINTLDAMVGYRSARYERFGWAAARLDDVVNLVPARVTGLLTVVSAPLVGGSPEEAWRVLRRDGAAHPSPNAGRCEASAAGALGVRLGGRNVYGGRVEERPVMGDGRAPDVADVRRAVRLGRVVGVAAAAVAAAAAVGRRRN